MVAIVLDLGALRADRRSSRSAADAAVLAGAVKLTPDPQLACNTAWTYAARNLGLDPLTTPGATPPDCTIFDPASFTCAPTTRLDATGSIGNYVITISHPVPDTDELLDAESVGPNITQPPSTDDGGSCDRLGVRIVHTRESIFSKVIGNQLNRTSGHSVARFLRFEEGGPEKPALVALHQTDDCTVDSGPGLIRAMPTGSQPALIYADSDASGPNCPGGSDTVYEGKNTGRIFADPSPTGAPGELGYFAATEALAFDTQPSYDENGALPPVGASKVKLQRRITRTPLDTLYNCASVSPLPPGCISGSGGTDVIDDISARYGDTAGVPGGFAVFPGPSVPGTCTTPPATFPAGLDWYIDCTTFEVSSSITFPDGDLVFAGNMEIKGGGILNINSLDASETTVVIRGTKGVGTASGGWALNWRRTFLLMDNPTCSRTSTSSCGVIKFQVGQPSLWTPPASGPTKNLIYWSESSQIHEVQGNPNFLWEGIFAAPNSVFDVQGNALVDASDVQLWVSKARVNNNSAELRLRADPDKSISTSRSSSALIR